MLRQRRLKLAAVLVAMAMAAGCAATLLMGVGGLAALGTYKWVEGTMEKDYPRPMKETFDATMEAARRLNLKISAEQYTPSESKILASTQDGTDVKVELLARPNEITTVKAAYALAQFPDIVNAPVAGAVYLYDVQVSPLGDAPAGIALITGAVGGALLAVETLGQYPGYGGLPDTARAGEQVGVGHPALGDGVSQGGNRRLLANHLFKGLRAILSGEYCICHTQKIKGSKV